MASRKLLLRLAVCLRLIKSKNQSKNQNRSLSPRVVNVNAKSADDWYRFFGVKYWEKVGKQYGRGENDAKTIGKFHELLESLPVEQRAADWLARDRIVRRFLARTAARTVQAGWSFAFFAQDFRGLALPPAKTEWRTWWS